VQTATTGQQPQVGCAEKRQQVRHHLEEHCGRDTEGMVSSVESLREAART
jgi:hypothetical protein